MWEIYVRAFPDNGTEVRVSNSGGRIPSFSPSNHELLYRTDDQRIMAGTYGVDQGAFVVHSVRQWSPVRLADTGVVANLDFDSHQNRFLGLMTPQQLDPSADHNATLILNFGERVRTRLTSDTR